MHVSALDSLRCRLLLPYILQSAYPGMMYTVYSVLRTCTLPAEEPPLPDVIFLKRRQTAGSSPSSYRSATCMQH